MADFSKSLRGICPSCSRAFSLTSRGKVWRHGCGGVMTYGLDPEPQSVETWGEYFERERRPYGQSVGSGNVHGGETHDEYWAVPRRAIEVVQEMAQEGTSADVPEIRIESLDCMNCGSKVPDDRLVPLYCTKFCQLTAEGIRYHRRVLANGKYRCDPLVRDAVAVTLQKLSQGVVVRRNKIPTEVRKRVFERTGGICSMPGCDRPATDLDHIEGRGYGDVASNLQALCNPCHLQKSKTDAKALSDDMIQERRDVIGRGLLDGFLRRYAARVFATSPRLVCDDHERWPERYRVFVGIRRGLRLSV